MSADVTTAGLFYAGLSLIIGVVVAMVERKSPPVMLDRANGRGKFSAPRDSFLGVILFVAICWPILALSLIFEGVKKQQ